MENKKKKRCGIVAALLLLVLAAGVGTYAWLTATADLHNVFTIGKIEAPDKKPDPENPEQPGTEAGGGAYLFETKWDPSAEHKMIPGSPMGKNPNVGIKNGSDDAFVFIYVKNAVVKNSAGLASTPYFTLNENWKPVSAEQVTTNGTEGQYVSGLFMYAKGAENGPVALGAKEAAKDVYTGELFSQVMIPGAMKSDDVVSGDGVKPEITVSAFIFGADQADGATNAADNAVGSGQGLGSDQAVTPPPPPRSRPAPHPHFRAGISVPL